MNIKTLYLYKIIFVILMLIIFGLLIVSGGSPALSLFIVGGLVVVISMGKIVLTNISLAFGAAVYNPMETQILVPWGGSNFMIFSSIMLSVLGLFIGKLVSSPMLGGILIVSFVSSAMLAGSIATTCRMTKTNFSGKHNFISACIQALVLVIGFLLIK